MLELCRGLNIQMQHNQLIKKIVFLDRVGLPERFSLRAPKLNHQWNNYDSTSPEQVIERSVGADVLIVDVLLQDVGCDGSKLRFFANNASHNADPAA